MSICQNYQFWASRKPPPFNYHNLRISQLYNRKLVRFELTYQRQQGASPLPSFFLGGFNPLPSFWMTELKHSSCRCKTAPRKKGSWVPDFRRDDEEGKPSRGRRFAFDSSSVSLYHYRFLSIIRQQGASAPWLNDDR